MTTGASNPDQEDRVRCQRYGVRLMKALFIHFRSAPRSVQRRQFQPAEACLIDSAGTDGVSLEMMKRQTLLEAMGHEVAICSAYHWADFPIPALEFESEEAAKMVRNLYGTRIVDFASETELKRASNVSLLELKQQLGRVVTDFKPDILLVHNILSLPVHPIATVALTELLRESGLPCSATHHDILSEGAYKFTPTCSLAKAILDEYYPPIMPNLIHWTINSRNQRALEKRGINAGVIHDTMDFDEKLNPAEQVKLRAALREKYSIRPGDIVLFVGARIVPNKQTELAGHLTATLQRHRKDIVGRKLYNGQVFSDENRLVLVLAGRPERTFAGYQKRLFELFGALGIAWLYVGNEVCPLRSETEGLYALYPDMYAMADFVLYPTGWEGFGNQLLEAFAAGLPVAIFEYPVFKEDIAPKGVKVLSLGDTILDERDTGWLVQIPIKVLNRVAYEMITILTTPDQYRGIITRNTMVGKKYFSFEVLRAHLHEVMDWASSFPH